MRHDGALLEKRELAAGARDGATGSSYGSFI